MFRFLVVITELLPIFQNNQWQPESIDILPKGDEWGLLHLFPIQQTAKMVL
jgi:hypothetical protein